MPRFFCRREILQLIAVAALTTSTTAHAGVWWIWFDDDGTPVISDRRDHPGAEPYRIGTFDEVALRQQNDPHRGYDYGRDAPAVPGHLLQLADEMAGKHRVERALILAVMGIESGFRESAVSRVGARGLMQLMPATAEDLNVNPDDPRENVDGGTRYLAWLLKHFGKMNIALAAYNAGPGRVKRAGGVVPAIPETVAYVRLVLALRDDFLRSGL